MGFPAVVGTRENLSNQQSCTNYYCMTDIDEARVISALQHKSKFNSDLFEKKFKFLGFHAVVPTRKDLSIDVSITY